MSKEINTYYKDFQFSIDRIEYHISQVFSFADFKNAITVSDAVERRLCIIGEALWRIDKLDKDAKISDKQKTIGLRHILTPEYDLINPEIIWKLIENNLPVLKEEVNNILNS
jgi:uncharacterized protein with HEPN domain